MLVSTHARRGLFPWGQFATSIARPTTALCKHLILIGLRENAPPPARVSFITYNDLRGFGAEKEEITYSISTPW